MYMHDSTQFDQYGETLQTALECAEHLELAL